MVYYSTKIFADMGLSDFLSQILAAVMNTVYAAGCWVLPYTIEAFGRRRIMIGSAIGCTVTMLIFVIMIALPHPTDATQWTAVVFVIFFNFFIGYGWVGVAWLYGAEVRYPLFSSRTANSYLADCTAQVSPYRKRIKCFWRMAVLFHHCICRRHRYHKHRLEDLDLAATVLHLCHHIPVLHVSRGSSFHKLDNHYNTDSLCFADWRKDIGRD